MVRPPPGVSSGSSVPCIASTNPFESASPSPKPVLFDCRVANLANCFPMIPSGAAHTDMILQPNDIVGTMDDEAKALV